METNRFQIPVQTVQEVQRELHTRMQEVLGSTLCYSMFSTLDGLDQLVTIYSNLIRRIVIIRSERNQLTKYVPTI